MYTPDNVTKCSVLLKCLSLLKMSSPSRIPVSRKSKSSKSQNRDAGRKEKNIKSKKNTKLATTTHEPRTDGPTNANKNSMHNVVQKQKNVADRRGISEIKRFDHLYLDTNLAELTSICKHKMHCLEHWPSFSFYMALCVHQPQSCIALRCLALCPISLPLIVLSCSAI